MRLYRSIPYLPLVNPTQSFTDYRVGVDVPGEYKVMLSSDDKRFGGHERIDVNGKYFTTPLEWNGRKNWLQVGLIHAINQVANRRCILLQGRLWFLACDRRVVEASALLQRIDKYALPNSLHDHIECSRLSLSLFPGRWQLVSLLLCSRIG